MWWMRRVRDFPATDFAGWRWRWRRLRDEVEVRAVDKGRPKDGSEAADVSGGQPDFAAVSAELQPRIIC